VQGRQRYARLYITVALTLGAIAASGGIAAADPASGVALAERQFRELDYELVLSTTDAVIAEPTASPAHKVAAYYVRGSAFVVLDRDADAAAAFAALLGLDPEFRSPNGAPPRIRAAFESARAAWRVRLEEELTTRYGAQLREVTLAVDPPERPVGGQPLTLRVRLTDPNKLVKRLVLGYRRASDREFSLLSIAAAESQLTIPGAVLESEREFRLAWYVHAVHDSGARLRREGDEDAPRWIAVTQGKVPVVTKKNRWFWPSVVVLVISAVAVPILIDQARDVGPQRISVGGS